MAHVSAPCEPRGASARGVPGARHACSGRESTAGAGGRAGGAHRCKCPKTKTSRRSCPGERHRAQTPSLRPGCSHRREPTRHGARAAPFLHDEAGPLLAVLLHLHLLIVRHDPPVQTATTRDASVRRTASRVRSRSFCARSCGRGVCEDGTRPRLAGLPACAPCLAADVASTLCVVRHACQLTVHIPYPPCSAAGWALRRGAVADGRTAVGESSRSRGGEVCGSMPPDPRRARSVETHLRGRLSPQPLRAELSKEITRTQHAGPLCTSNALRGSFLHSGFYLGARARAGVIVRVG